MAIVQEIAVYMFFLLSQIFAFSVVQNFILHVYNVYVCVLPFVLGTTCLYESHTGDDVPS